MVFEIKSYLPFMLGFSVINLAGFTGDAANSYPTVDDLPGYSTENFLQANPTLAKKYFSTHPRDFCTLGGEETLSQLLQEKNFSSLVQHIDKHWLDEKALEAFQNPNSKGYSWLYGCIQGLDWRKVYNQNPVIQGCFTEIFPAVQTHMGFDVSLEIIKAAFTQEWAIATQYAAAPLNPLIFAAQSPEIKPLKIVEDNTYLFKEGDLKVVSKYDRGEIISFLGEWEKLPMKQNIAEGGKPLGSNGMGFLTNYFESGSVPGLDFVVKINWQGVTYAFSNVEAAFQCGKRLLSGHITNPAEIHAYTKATAEESKGFGPGSRVLNLKYAFDASHIPLVNDLMYSLVLQKLINFPALGSKLVAETNNRLIIEGNEWGDAFWGMPFNGRELSPGQNKLGQILMYARDVIRMYRDCGVSPHMPVPLLQRGKIDTGEIEEDVAVALQEITSSSRHIGADADTLLQCPAEIAFNRIKDELFQPLVDSSDTQITWTHWTLIEEKVRNALYGENLSIDDRWGMIKTAFRDILIDRLDEVNWGHYDEFIQKSGKSNSLYPILQGLPEQKSTSFPPKETHHSASSEGRASSPQDPAEMAFNRIKDELFKPLVDNSDTQITWHHWKLIEGELKNALSYKSLTINQLWTAIRDSFRIVLIDSSVGLSWDDYDKFIQRPEKGSRRNELYPILVELKDSES